MLSGATFHREDVHEESVAKSDLDKLSRHVLGISGLETLGDPPVLVVALAEGHGVADEEEEHLDTLRLCISDGVLVGVDGEAHNSLALQDTRPPADALTPDRATAMRGERVLGVDVGDLVAVELAGDAKESHLPSATA